MVDGVDWRRGDCLRGFASVRGTGQSRVGLSFPRGCSAGFPWSRAAKAAYSSSPLSGGRDWPARGCHLLRAGQLGIGKLFDRLWLSPLSSRVSLGRCRGFVFSKGFNVASFYILRDKAKCRLHLHVAGDVSPKSAKRDADACREEKHPRRITHRLLEPELPSPWDGRGAAGLPTLRGCQASRSPRNALNRANSLGLRSSLRPGETVRWSVTSASLRPCSRISGTRYSAMLSIAAVVSWLA